MGKGPNSTVGYQNLIDKLKRKINYYKVWYHNGSEEAEIVVEMDEMVSKLDDWVQDSCNEWNNQNVPEEVFSNQISEFRVFLDVKIEEDASKIQDRIETNKRDISSKDHPKYHDNLVESMESVLENFNRERTRLRNALRNAEDSLDKGKKVAVVESNLAEIEENEQGRIDEIEDNIRDMRKICVQNNLVRSLKISRMLP